MLIECRKCGYQKEKDPARNLEFCPQDGMLMRPIKTISSTNFRITETGEALETNPERTKRIIKILLPWFYEVHDQLFSNAKMPESLPPKSVGRGSYEHVMYLTMGVSIDYQRDADELWAAARRTFEDSKTRWLFNPREVSSKDMRKIIPAINKHRLARKPRKDAWIWHRVSTSFAKLFDGDPRKLFSKHNYDAFQIYRSMRDRDIYGRLFPYLAGSTGTSKILSLWIRALHDEANLPLSNIEKVPIPVDIHTARSTLAIGTLYGIYNNSFGKLAKLIQDTWREACKDTENYPLQLDEPLWNLSRHGCASRESDTCPVKNNCRLRNYCVKGTIKISQGSGSLINTELPRG